jgi:hypothetical protein
MVWLLKNRRVIRAVFCFKHIGAPAANTRISSDGSLAGRAEFKMDVNLNEVRSTKLKQINKINNYINK